MAELGPGARPLAPSLRLSFAEVIAMEALSAEGGGQDTLGGGALKGGGLGTQVTAQL